MATLEQLQSALVKADAAGDVEAARAFAGEIRRMRSSAPSPEAATKPKEESTFETYRNGLASGPINLYLGAKQMLGGLSPEEQSIYAQNKESEKKAPGTSFLSNVLTTVPTMLIPGVNTVAGATAVGAGLGALQPVGGEQTAGNIVRGKLTNAAIGGAVGGASQFTADKIGSAVRNRLATSTADAQATASRNSLRDAALSEGREAGYVVPQSQVQPTFLSNRVESLGGKAAVKQEASIRNQEVTNALARKALGIADDQPISQGALEGIRKTSGDVYAEVASLSPIAKQDLEALKVARNEAQGWFTAYNRSARPDDLAKAKAARELSDMLEKSLEAEAVTAGRTDLIPKLINARKQIAKTYTVERALNKATGDVSAPVLGRLVDKGKPLSDGLDVIGRFNQSFPQVTRPAAGTQAPGVSFFEPVTAGVAGMMGHAATGSPMGLLAAGVPLLRGPARSLALSGPMQSAPTYGTNRLLQLAGGAQPETINALARMIGMGGAASLAAE